MCMLYNDGQNVFNKNYSCTVSTISLELPTDSGVQQNVLKVLRVTLPEIFELQLIAIKWIIKMRYMSTHFQIQMHFFAFKDGICYESASKVNIIVWHDITLHSRSNIFCDRSHRHNVPKTHCIRCYCPQVIVMSSNAAFRPQSNTIMMQGSTIPPIPRETSPGPRSAIATQVYDAM